MPVLLLLWFMLHSLFTSMILYDFSLAENIVVNILMATFAIGIAVIGSIV